MGAKPIELRATTCRAAECGEQIVFLKTQRGKSMPVDAHSVEPGDVYYEHGRHSSHYSTCVAAGQFRSPRTKDD